jgi:hypothetical protein
LLIAPALLALTLLGLIVGVRFMSVRLRSKRLENLELRPNCLLTRSPLVFITGRRSLFYFLNYWNEIPGFLREHGYDVKVCSLPWRGVDSRYQVLADFIERSPQPVHLIADSTSKVEVEKLLLTKRGRLSSFQFAEDITGACRLEDAIGLNNDGMWSVESLYLDHAIALAENEH